MKVRTIGAAGSDKRRKAALQRSGLKRKLRRRVDPQFAESLRQYAREYRKRNAAKLLTLRKVWLKANREYLNAYYRRLYELDPARREYLARKTREYRAKKRAPLGLERGIALGANSSGGQVGRAGLVQT